MRSLREGWLAVSSITVLQIYISRLQSRVFSRCQRYSPSSPPFWSSSSSSSSWVTLVNLLSYYLVLLLWSNNPLPKVGHRRKFSPMTVSQRSTKKNRGRKRVIRGATEDRGQEKKPKKRKKRIDSLFSRFFLSISKIYFYSEYSS